MWSPHASHGSRTVRGELLGGARKRLGVVQLAEESAGPWQLQGAHTSACLFVLLLSQFGALGRMVARAQEVAGVGLDVRQ